MAAQSQVRKVQEVHDGAERKGALTGSRLCVRSYKPISNSINSPRTDSSQI
jgi:hypothetical protein